MNEETTNKIIDEIKKEHPRFDSEATIRRAAEITWHMWNHGECYEDGDYSAEELYSQLSDLRWGFEALMELFENEASVKECAI